MQSIQKDPRLKLLIKEALHSMLYTPVEKHFKHRLDFIIVRNTVLSSSEHTAFNYKGIHYICDNGPIPRKWTRLVPQLRSQMDEYLADVKQLHEKEIPFVHGYINQVLNASDNPRDYLRLLPDSIHPAINKLIESFPYVGSQLSDERVAMMWSQNEASINLIKQRMMTNLIL